MFACSNPSHKAQGVASRSQSPFERLSVATNSKIEWTEATWNPVAGCTILSPGCTNCYAMRLAARLAVMGQDKYVGTTRKSGHKWNGTVKTDASSLDVPRRWRKGRLIFVNSMSDLLHEGVPFEFIRAVFTVMEETPQHTYQVLTKRAERLEQLSKKLPWPKNVWIECQSRVKHTPTASSISAAARRRHAS
jgi:protein gp37